jgi:hypothetical protein
MVPRNGRVGLLEKRLIAVSSMGLGHSATLAGSIYDRDTDDEMLLDDDTDWHNNHGDDPAPNTMTMLDSAEFNMDWARGIESGMGLGDSVHISLDGYHAPPSEYDTIADDTLVLGNAVFISSSNHVDLASCDPDGGDDAEVVGLVKVGGSANDTVTILTDGSLELTDWTAIIGTTNLTAGSIYYLQETPGTIGTTATTTDGFVVTRVGRAITTTKLDIEIGEVVDL